MNSLNQPSTLFNISSFNHTNVPQLYGIKAVGDRVHIDENGIQIIQTNLPAVLVLFGFMVEFLNVTLTKKQANYSDDCTDFWHSEAVLSSAISKGVAKIDVELSEPGRYYVCFQQNRIENNTKIIKEWLHQGSNYHVTLMVSNRLMPVPLQISLIILCLLLSGTFSGLNLGLMSLDINELEVIIRCGTEIEKQYAKAIEPIRKQGNFLLCAILFGNVLVNSTLTILMDDLTSGLVAVCVSTLSIVIFGEIVPQAICSRHGLAVGAKTIYITKLFMLLTFPLSFVVSKILDHVLGDEIGHVYDRERLMEYIKVTKTYNKLEEDEMNIISGALGLKLKTAEDVMTRLEDAFMLPINSILDFNTLSEISKKGYSRIPVFDTDRKNVVGLLHTKDLTFVDPDDKKPLKTIIEFYRHPLVHTDAEEKLNIVLNHFKHGKSHLAFVRKLYDGGDEDPYYEIVGLVTLEDVIEEILQMEIMDETDCLTDNRKKQKRKDTQFRQDFSDFAKIGEGEVGLQAISPQVALATFQYLSTAIEPFDRKFITEHILRRLIAQKIYYSIEIDENERTFMIGHDSASKEEDESKYLYKYGKSADYFIMILEGKVRVTVGNESLTYESGPFTYFGVSALKPPALAAKILLGGSSICNSSNTALNNLASLQARKQSLNLIQNIQNIQNLQNIQNISRPPSPPESSIAIENQPLQIPPGSIPSSPEILSLIRSPSGNSDMLSARASSASQLQNQQQMIESGQTFIPDFTVKPVENTLYMKIPRKVYLTAFKASLMDRKDEFLEADFQLFKEEIDFILNPTLATNKIIGYNNQQQQNKMKKSSSEVMKEKKFSVGTCSPKKASQESQSLVHQSSTGHPTKALKRKKSLIEIITFSTPQSPKSTTKKVIKHQSVLSSTSNQPDPLTISSINSANNSSTNVNSLQNQTNTPNLISTTAQLDNQLQNVIVQKNGLKENRTKY